MGRNTVALTMSPGNPAATRPKTLSGEMGSTMAEEMPRASPADLLPVWQRIAWMAAVWFASVALLGLASWLIATLIA